MSTVASAWGKAWGKAFGAAFGQTTPTPPIVRPDADHFVYRTGPARYTGDPTIARLAQRIANNRRRR